MTTDTEAAEDRIRRLPCWRGDIVIEPLSGGLSNLNFTITDSDRRCVVRMVGDDVPVHNVMRFNELSGLRAAYAIGLTPGLIHSEPGIMVIEHIDGKTLDADDIADPAMLPRVVAAVRHLHDEGKHHITGPCLAFWVYRVNRSYAHLLRAGGSRMVDRLDRLMAINDELEATTGPVTMTFCHSDLLCANFMDDGERIWIIDWEHCGYGARLFDLANISSNAQLPEDAERLMLEAYYNEPVDAGRWKRFKALRVGSHLREAMWSMASEIHLDLDVDYEAYTRENLDAFEAAYEDFRAL